MTDQQVVDRLDLIQATLQLAFKSQLDQVREVIRSDEITAAILDETDDWVSSKKLQTRVAKAAKTSERTVRSRLSHLVAQRVIVSRGSERALEYRRTGLV